MPKGAKEPTLARAPAPAQHSDLMSCPAPVFSQGSAEQGLALQARAGRMCTEGGCADFVREWLSDSKECGNTFRTAEMRIGAGIPGGAQRMEKPR